MKRGYVYIMTNKNKTTLYTGVTSDTSKRVLEHKNHVHRGSFTDRYNLEFLVYYEVIYGMINAINREKQIKAGSRKKKEDLINQKNPNWEDLFFEISNQ